MTVAGQPTATSYTWDNENRLTGITQASAAVSFQYDNANRRTQLTLAQRNRGGVRLRHGLAASAMTWTLSNVPVGDLEYAYDANGHVIQKTGSFAQTDLPQPVTGNTFNADNEMTAVNGTAISYDQNGNLLNDGTKTYTWDARNHLNAISGGASASLVHSSSV
jgi:YD repeat-containing protein